MPDSVDSPMGSKSESKWDSGAVKQALATPPFNGQVQNLETWFDGLGVTERAGILFSLVNRCSPSELAYVAEIAHSRKQDEKYAVFDRLVRDPVRDPVRDAARDPVPVREAATHTPPVEHSAAHSASLRMQSSPIRPYIGKQDHFQQAFLRPQTFNPWPISQEITRPKSATDWWSVPPPQPIGRPKEEKHHSDSEDTRRSRPFHAPTPTASTSSPSHGEYKRSVNFKDPELLADIGAWLRSLRLHKYTDNLAGMKWQDVVKLNDHQLEERGINALGARRKMLKMFAEIRAAQDAGTLPK